MTKTKDYIAMVIGSTGAVGRELVAELVASDKCAKVVAVCRRDIPQDKWTTSFPSLDTSKADGKLQIRQVDFDKLGEDCISEADKVDASFCCLGTTRRDAGSAEAFRNVDLGYAQRFGELSNAAKVPYFGLLSAMNANKDSWFLYPKTKGEAEEAIKAFAFPRTAIFRPGLIDRGDLARIAEKLALWVVPSITTKLIAKSMLRDFEAEGTNKGTRVWSHADMKEVTD